MLTIICMSYVYETHAVSDVKELVGENVLLTGIPRSGTTLLTALLDYPPSSVAIGEPQGMGSWQSGFAADHIGFVKKLKEYSLQIRERIYQKQSFKDRIAVDANPLTNYVDNTAGGRTKRYVIANRKVESVESRFTLVLKAPVIFTAVLPAIVSDGSYKVIAIIRNPISTILSWNSVDFPISKGRLPAGEGYWADLYNVASADCSIIEKQARIWELFARRYSQYQNKIILLRYEDVVHNFEEVSSVIGIPLRRVEVENMNTNPIYDYSLKEKIKDALIRYSPTSQLLYPQFKSIIDEYK